MIYITPLTHKGAVCCCAMFVYLQYNREAEHRLPEVEQLIDGLDNRDVEQVRTLKCVSHYTTVDILKILSW
jgi:hypothetical protein